MQTEELLVEVIGEDDETVLESLWDIGLAFDEGDAMGFTLSFHFHPNDFFTNTVLTKHYSMKCEPDKEDPFSFEASFRCLSTFSIFSSQVTVLPQGPEIYKCEGCKVNWKEGKNVTVKQVKKKVKKGKDKGKTVTKEVKADSFFHFFSPPALPDDPEAEVDEEVQMLLQQDFQIGHYLRERIIPRAVLFFTGEEQGDDEEESDDEDDEDGEDDDDESDEELANRPKLKARKGKGGMGGGQEANPECKQQ